MPRVTRFPQGLLCVDVETDGLHPHLGHRPFLVGAEDERGRVIIADVNRDGGGLCAGIGGREALAPIRRGVEDPRVVKVAHNAKFEIRMLRAMGWKPRGRWICTMNLVVMLDEYSKLGLKHLAKRFLGVEYPEADLIQAWVDAENRDRRAPWLAALREEYRRRFRRSRVGSIPEYTEAVKLGEGAPPEATYRDFYESSGMPEIMRAYLEEDLDSPLRLVWALLPQVAEHFARPFEVECDLVPFVADMEDNGLPVDIAAAHDKAEQYRREAREAAALMFREAGGEFNPNSPQQLLPLLKRRGLKISSTAKGVLAQHEDSDALVAALLNYRACIKVLLYFEKFLRVCDEDGIMHASFWQNGEDEGIKTGRFSIKEPDLQTLPGGYRGTVGNRGKDVRRAIVAHPGCNLFMVDFAQVEPRIFAHYTQERKLTEPISKGIDIYLAFVRIFFGKSTFKGWDPEKPKDLPALLKQRRSDSKTIILAITYGMGIDKMARNLGVKNEIARGMRAKCFQRLPSMRTLMRSTSNDILRKGFVECVFGRRYRVPRALPYKGINAIIQGAAAIVMKRAIAACGEVISQWNEEHYPGVDPLDREAMRVRPIARMLLTVHDEILFSVPFGDEDELMPRIKAAMEGVAPELSVPLECDVSWGPHGGSWGDKIDWHVGMAQEKIPEGWGKSPDGTVKPIVGQIS